METAENKRDFLLGVPLEDMSGFDNTIPLEYRYFVPLVHKLLLRIGIPKSKLKGVHLARRFTPTMAAFDGASKEAVML